MRRAVAAVLAPIRARLPGLAVILALAAIWQSVSINEIVDPAFLPPLSVVLAAWGKALAGGPLLASFGETLTHMFTGYAAAIVVGVSLGVLMGRVRLIHALVEPLVELVRPVPIPAFIPLLILFLGIENSLKISVVFIGALFPILLAAYAGVRSVSAGMRETAQTFGLSWWQSVWEITIPAAAPAIFVGLRTSLALSLIVATVAEMIAGTGGIGYFVLQAEQGLRVPEMYVGILMLAVTGYAMNMVFLTVDRVLLGWHHAPRQ